MTDEQIKCCKNSDKCSAQTKSPAELLYYKYEIMQKQYPDHILFYRLGDFYEAFGKSAELASDCLGLTLISKNCGSFGSIPMCGVPYHAIKIYVKKLRKYHGVVLMHFDFELEEYYPKFVSEDDETQNGGGQMTKEQEDILFKLVLKLERNKNKPDMHSFTAQTKAGSVYVEAREDGIFICHEKYSGERNNFVGTAIAATNRLLELGIKPDTIRM